MRIIKSLCTALATFFVVYLLGAFYEVSFDISLWSSEARVAVAAFGGFGAFIAYSIAI